MGLTVVEVVQKLESLKHERAVWMEMVEHLSKFIDLDIKRADHGIEASDCIVSPVPQDVVREFIEYINNQEIEPLNLQIEELERLGVYQETKDDDPEPNRKGKEKSNQEKGAKASKKKPKPKRESQTGVRRLPPRPGRKAQGSR